MSPSYFVATLLILLFTTSQSETVDCGSADCSCNNKNEWCNLECLAWRDCEDSSLTCNPGYPCNIDCSSGTELNGESCSNAVINSNNATHLTILCSEWHDCLSATINCDNAETCNVICQSSGGQTEICKSLTLNCGTSECSITCDSDSCGNINVDTSTAHSFQCIGYRPACFAAPNAIYPPTASPTLEPTIETTSLPTLEPTFEPTNYPTLLPTIQPTLFPTLLPTNQPSLTPTIKPTFAPTNHPTSVPTMQPTASPTKQPTIGPTISPTMPPTQSIESTSTTPSPILQIVPRITGSSETSVSDTISVENIDAVENTSNEGTDSLVVYLMNNLVVSVLCGLIILGALVCVICYCCIKQRYTFKRRLKNDDGKNDDDKNDDDKNVQIKPAVNAYEDKERVSTQSHLSFSIQIDEFSVGNNSPYNNINYAAFGRTSASFNGSSLISPSSMVNISPHLAVPLSNSPINEYKEESVSPIVSLSVLPPPPPPSTYDNDNDDMEGMRIHKENMTMIINDQFIISPTNDEEEKEAVVVDGDGDLMLTNNPNVENDEFVIKGEDDSECHETTGAEYELSTGGGLCEISISEIEPIVTGHFIA